MTRPKALTPARFTRGSTRRLATTALSGLLRPGRERRLRRALEGSEQDRRAYGQLVRLFLALEGDPAGDRGLTAAQAARVLERALPPEARTGEAPAGSAWSVPQGEDRAPSRRAWLAAAAGLAVLVVVVLGGLLGLRRPEEPRGLWASRGHATSAQGRLGLRAFCARGGRLLAPPHRSGPLSPEASCRLDDELQLLVLQVGHPHLLVLGHLRTPTGEERLFYFPVPPTGRSGAAPLAPQYEPLGPAIRLVVNHGPGELRVVALASGEPLEAAAVHEWLRMLDPEESAAELFHRLAGGRVLAAELRVHLEDGGHR